MNNDRDPFIGPKLMHALAFLGAGAILVQVALVFAAPFLL